MASPGHSGDPPPRQDQLIPSGSAESSTDVSKRGSRSSSRPGTRVSKGKQKVRFGHESYQEEGNEYPWGMDTVEGAITPHGLQANNAFPYRRHSLSHIGNHHPALTLDVDATDSQDIADSRERSPIRSLRPSNMRAPSIESNLSDVSDLTMKIPGKDRVMDEHALEVARSQRVAQSKARRLSRHLNSQSAPGSMTASPPRSGSSSPDPMASTGTPLDLNNIPLRKLKRRKHYSIEDDTDEDDEGDQSASPHWSNFAIKAAKSYLRGPKPQVDPHALRRVKAHEPPLPSGRVTPIYERDPHYYVPRPQSYREGFLSASLRLYQEQGARPALATIPGGPTAVARANERASFSGPGNEAASSSRHHSVISPLSSGASTPAPRHKKWYYKNEQNYSTSSVRQLIQSSTVLAQPAISGPREGRSPISPRPKLRSRSTGALDLLLGRNLGRRPDESIRIQVHIAETLSRQHYLVKLCQALMTYGAPTHRLEEYMRMSARVLEIQSQFFYIPTCMVIAFDDDATHTTEIKLVRAPQGIDLGKLKDTHDIYKEVVHDKIGVEEAMPRLDEVMKRENLYGPRFLVLMYGLSSASVAPFAFSARFVDLPIAFLLGMFLGWLQLIVAPRSDLYSNIFEVSAAVAMSFLSRAFGSIKGGHLFCFSALAQSSIALILPGYTLLCGSLELQSKSIVAGSVRMVYAVIYSLFLGFGITIGTALYAALDKKAISTTSCENPMRQEITWIFVPVFTACLIIINQGRIKQMPVMIIIAFTGYIVNHFAAVQFGNIQVSQAIGALAIGIMANLYSRLRHGLAAAALLPAIFVQVPSGLAAGGSLISGVANADQLTGNSGGSATRGKGNMGTMHAVGGNDMVFTVGYSMIQVAVGITVGLFLSSLIIYPLGKRRSGLFSF